MYTFVICDKENVYAELLEEAEAIAAYRVARKNNPDKGIELWYGRFIYNEEDGWKQMI